MTLKSRLTHAFNACSYAALQRRKVLKPLRAAAAKSKTATAAFDWLSQQRNITIAFDESLADTKTIGRYNRDGKRRWITLSPKYKEHKVEEQLDTLVHEIRHAWQDQQGMMLPNNLRYNLEHGMQHAFLQLCLEEADAYAHGRMARHEAEGGDYFAYGFQKSYSHWFNAYAQGYLDDFVKKWGELLKVSEVHLDQPNGGDTIRAIVDGCRRQPLFVMDKDTLFAMTQAFGGMGYLRHGNYHMVVEHLHLPAAAALYAADTNQPVIALEKRVAALKAVTRLPRTTAPYARFA